MKKLLSIAIAIIAILAMTVPVMADNVGTSVTINGTGGGAPIVKCKWEAQSCGSELYSAESGDVPHHTVLTYNTKPVGTQLLPSGVKCENITYNLYAIVTDTSGMGNISQVYAYVFSPQDSPAPYNTPTAPAPDNRPYFKYKIDFQRFSSLGTGGAGTAAIPAFNDAYAANLVTFCAGYTHDDITNLTSTGELDKNIAELWVGTANLTYEQPAGFYEVDVYAYDGAISTALVNYFYYVPQNGFAIDFNKVDYGSVIVGTEKNISGDKIWNPPTDALPTIRNTGNTWETVSINQTDFAFGFAGAGPGTHITATSASGISGSNWNLYYDAKMGNSTANEMWYDPFTKVTLPNALGLSKKDEMDFSIKVKNPVSAQTYTGAMTICCDNVSFGFSGAVTGDPDPCP